MIFSVVLLVGLTYSGLIPPTSQSVPSIGTILLGMALVTIVLSGIVPKLLGRKTPDRVRAETVFFMQSIVSAALQESCGMFGFVIYVVTGSYHNALLAFGLSLATLFLSFPTKNRFETKVAELLSNQR